MLRIAYSMDVTDESDGYVRLLEDALAATTTALVPGKFAVELLPFLRYMPAWFPGSGKQRVFTECKTLFRTLEDTAYAHVKDTIVSSPHCATCYIKTDFFCRRRRGHRPR